MSFSNLLLAAAVLTNAVQISETLPRGRGGVPFSIVGTLTQPPWPCLLFTVTDETGGILLHLAPTCTNEMSSFRAGDRIRATGRLTSEEFGISFADCTNLTRLACGAIPPARAITARELQSGRHDGLPVEINGTVRECFTDEIDPEWFYLSVTDGDAPFLAVLSSIDRDLRPLRDLENAEVTVSGACIAHGTGHRRITGRMILVPDPASIRLRRAAPADPFAVPFIEDWPTYCPDEIARMGRRKLRGQVVAALEDGSALLRTDCGAVHRLRFRSEPPACGAFVEAAGLPETDLYRINLSNAVWRPVRPFAIPDMGITPLSAAQLFTDERGRRQFNTRHHGQVVRLAGKVMDLPSPSSGQGALTLRSGDFTIPVDVSADRRILDRLSVGCEIEVTGVYFVRTENWNPCTPFPHTTGLALALRTPEDVRILSHPPWLTPARTLAVIAFLVLTLAAILVWNRILWHVVSRKSRELLKEQVAQIRASLRVSERTLLAVELHDTLSQNLSGVACQIAATRGTLPDGAETSVRYLATAERMLLSCRTELRRCLWDLRGDALEETDFAEAIRKTLAPVAGDAATVIRFNVPRARLSDTTAHAVLCIIRELVSNAIRHGGAGAVRIAGEFHEGVLSFSVRDDGSGFDPSRCEGPAGGHFGLEGIRERVRRLNGQFTLSSEPGRGTRAEVTIS